MIIDKEGITQKLTEIFNTVDNSERRLKIWTGPGGMDLFEEALQKDAGITRVYIGHKIPRIMRRIKDVNIRQSHTGRYYRLIVPKFKYTPGYTFTTL